MPRGGTHKNILNLMYIINLNIFIFSLSQQTQKQKSVIVNLINGGDGGDLLIFFLRAWRGIGD